MCLYVSSTIIDRLTEYEEVIGKGKRVLGIVGKLPHMSQRGWQAQWGGTYKKTNSAA